MDKKALRREIGARKRALSSAEIESWSSLLTDKRKLICEIYTLKGFPSQWGSVCEAD